MSRVVSQSRSPRYQEAPYGGGGPNGNTPHTGGDGDGHSEERRTQTYRDRLRRCRLGVALSMVSVTVLFVALTTAYLVRQHSSPVNEDGERIVPWLHLTLPPLLMVNTIILLLSSLTLELARRNLRRQVLFAPLAEIPGIKKERETSVPWLAMTLVLAFGFLAGQFAAWQSMQRAGFYLMGNPSSMFFYLLTGAHAFHLSVGILVLLYAATSHFVARALETRCLIVDVTSWYWHFMAMLWICIYAVLYFAR